MTCLTSLHFCVFVAAIDALPASAAEPIVVEGRVAAVTVYQGQALVTRELEVPRPQGLLEVVVTNLPEYVLPGSMFADPADGVQVRSVCYSARPIEERHVRLRGQWPTGDHFDRPVHVASSVTGKVQRRRLVASSACSCFA